MDDQILRLFCHASNERGVPILSIQYRSNDDMDSSLLRKEKGEFERNSRECRPDDEDHPRAWRRFACTAIPNSRASK
jgi:hypothetical protein